MPTEPLLSSPAGVGTEKSATRPARWVVPALVLAVGTFAMGTDSFVLAGILPQIRSGLHVSESSAGQVVTAFALTYAISAPFLAAATHKLPRKPLMAMALTVFVGANLFGAAAPNLTLLLVARVLAALGAASFTPTASAAVVALAGPERRGRALSVILGGLAVGTVFGVPAGTAIGQHLGWQASLVFIAAVAALALLGLLAVLPALALPPPVPLAKRFALLVNRQILLVIAVGIVATGSGIVLYTYIAHVLAATAAITGAMLTVALLCWGVGGSVGAFASGRLSDHFGANRTLVVAIIAMALVLLGLGFASQESAVLPLMILGGAASWSVNAPLNHRLTGLVPDLPGVAISFNSSGTYLGQAIGAALGGIFLAHGVTATTLCVIAAAGGGLALLLELASIRPSRVSHAAGVIRH